MGQIGAFANLRHTFWAKTLAKMIDVLLDSPSMILNAHLIEESDILEFPQH
jgi:hypothetical protein